MVSSHFASCARASFRRARLPLLSHDALASGHEIGEQLLGLKGDVLHELPDRLLQGLRGYLEVAAGRPHVGAMLAGIGGRAAWLLLREHGRALDPRVLARTADQPLQQARVRAAARTGLGVGHSHVVGLLPQLCTHDLALGVEHGLHPFGGRPDARTVW
jgi:hypothetical protein